jgi:hypothetical protein
MGEHEIHDRQSGVETPRAFTERSLVGDHHDRVELRSEKRSNALRKAMVRSRQEDRRRRRDHGQRLSETTSVKNP